VSRSGNGFEKPNHTQTPNSFFDEIMKEIDTMAELKVTLAIIRQTIGWHRKRVRFGVGKIARLTGLARNSVVTGAEAAEARGTIVRVETEGEAVWELVIDEDPPSSVEGAEIDGSDVEGTPPQTLTKTPSNLEGLKRKKEIDSNKKILIINPITAQLFTDTFGEFYNPKEQTRWEVLHDSVGSDRAGDLIAWASKKEIHLANRSGLLDSLETAAKNWKEKPAKKLTAAQSGDPSKYLSPEYADYIEH
jgi:hypothetical protein